MKALLACLICLPSLLFCQSLERQVIGSTGTISGSIISSSTVGPSILFTSSLADTLLLTQGFQQPAENSLLVELIITSASCAFPQSGSVEFLISGCPGPYIIAWENQSSESLVENLSQGSYNFSISSDQCTFTGNAIVGSSDDCDDIIPTVVTLNNDGVNETWIVPELSLHQNAENKVSILNRWAQVVWEGTNYDNTNTVWRGDNMRGVLLPAGTYFYRIQSNSEEKTGYIELLR